MFGLHSLVWTVATYNREKSLLEIDERYLMLSNEICIFVGPHKCVVQCHGCLQVRNEKTKQNAIVLLLLSNYIMYLH